MSKLSTDKKKPNLLSGKVYTGRELYAAMFISGMNKKPVEDLKTRVKAAYVDAGTVLPVSMDSLLEWLLVSGSLVIVGGDILQGDILYISSIEVIMQSGDIFIHILQGEGGQYIRKDYRSFDVKGRKLDDPVDDADAPLAVLSGVVLYPNGYGILYGPQKTLLRLEQIYDALAITTKYEAMLFIAGGANSARAINDMLEADLSVDRPIIRLLPDETLQQPNFSSLSSRLLKEVDMLKVAWLEATFNLATFPQESGIARRYLMEPFINKTNELQGQLVDIYRALGVTVEFAPADLTDTQEDVEQLDMIASAQERGWITDDEARSKARGVLNLAPEIPAGNGEKRIGLSNHAIQARDNSDTR